MPPTTTTSSPRPSWPASFRPPMPSPPHEKAYAIQAGREIRIMVKPEEIDEDHMILLAHDIAKKIEDEMEYPGQIKVNLIRETKAVDYAK